MLLKLVLRSIVKFHLLRAWIILHWARKFALLRFGNVLDLLGFACLHRINIFLVKELPEISINIEWTWAVFLKSRVISQCGPLLLFLIASGEINDWELMIKFGVTKVWTITDRWRCNRWCVDRHFNKRAIIIVAIKTVVILIEYVSNSVQELFKVQF